MTHAHEGMWAWQICISDLHKLVSARSTGTVGMYTQHSMSFQRDVQHGRTAASSPATGTRARPHSHAVPPKRPRPSLANAPPGGQASAKQRRLSHQKPPAAALETSPVHLAAHQLLRARRLDAGARLGAKCLNGAALATSCSSSKAASPLTTSSRGPTKDIRPSVPCKMSW